nr:dynamin family protein [uncultured Flavobacterium sp.]
MNTHFLSDIQQKRENFKKYAQKAVEYNWISQQEYDEFISKIENSKLVIGVIGQMKAGKSTFLNALIFNDEVLPAATTPMTASLSILTYGPEKKLEAEFYTTQEWEELKMSATENEKDYENDTNKQSKIKAAKEIVSKAIKIESQISTLLGTKKQDAFENLIEYVGAEGKYIAITKSVKIEYPLDYLKGVEIVDTPGFNDPVVSREDRTKQFLSRADVVIMLLYAGRAFDATDNDIIFNKVRSVGVGKLLIGVNKYDINYSQGETESQMINYVKEQLLNASKQHSSNSIAELIKERDPLLISANMALMAKMDLGKIKNNENLKFYYHKALDDFEISSQKQMHEKSLMPQFEQAIKTYILDDKDKILINKPLNLIKQKGENKQVELITKNEEINNELIITNKPDHELEDLLSNTQKAEKRFNKKIENFEIELNDKLKKLSKNIILEIGDILLKYKSNAISHVDSKFAVWDTEKLFGEIFQILEKLDRELKYYFLNKNNDIKSSINKINTDFIHEVEEILEKYLEDFEINDFIKGFKKHLSDDILDLSLNNLIPNSSNNEEYTFMDGVAAFIHGATFGLMNLATAKSDAKNKIEFFFSNLELEKVESILQNYRKDIIAIIKQDLFIEFLTPISNKTQELIEDKTNREVKIKELIQKAEANKQDLLNIKNEIETMNIFENI